MPKKIRTMDGTVTLPAQRSMSLKQAFNCEHAIEKRCRCRCAGKFHGAARVSRDQIRPEEFDQLPHYDPHFVRLEDKGLRQIVSCKEVRARRRGVVCILTLSCGHTVRRSASAIGPNRTRAFCKHCRPSAVQASQVRRSTGQPGGTLMTYFEKKGR